MSKEMFMPKRNYKLQKEGLIVLIKNKDHSGNKAVDIFTLDAFFTMNHNSYPYGGKQITLMNINYQETKTFFWDISDEEFETLILPYKNTRMFKLMTRDYAIESFFRPSKISKYKLGSE
jgi:hypothetical protein